MTLKLTNHQPSKRLLRFLPWAAVGLCFFLILSSSTVQAERITVNPVEWTPVITEFQIDKYARSVFTEPPFTKVESKYPTIPSAWKTLKDMVKIRLRGGWWTEEEPVISGWKTWVAEEDSGIEVMRSDKVPEDFVPVRNFLRGGPVPVRWRIEIWGRYRFPDNPSLGPGDEEYQKLIKKKIEVRDFSLKVYKVEGDFSLKNIRNEVSPEPFKVLGERDFRKYLADYESQDYHLKRGASYIGEAQLKMKLFFPEVDEQADTWEETPVEASLRFMSGSQVDFRIISSQIKSRRLE